LYAPRSTKLKSGARDQIFDRARYHHLVRPAIAATRRRDMHRDFLRRPAPMRCARSVCRKDAPAGPAGFALDCHTGECELHCGNVDGIAVHIAARVAAIAGPDEVMVSSTVKDLVAGLRTSVRRSRRVQPQGRTWRMAVIRRSIER